MRRWIWRLLLAAAVMALLTVGASAADTIVEEGGVRYNLTTGTVLGPVSKDNVVSVTIRATVNGSVIKSIAPDAFNGCGKLTRVEMESGIETVGNSAFNSCTLLQSVLLPDSISDIGDYAFANCGRLNNVVLPTILTDIKTGTFANCTSLKSIYIATVKHIHPSAFSGSGVAVLHRDTKDDLKQDDTPALPVHITTRIPGLKTEPTCVLQGKQAYSYNCTEGCGGKFNFSQNQPIPALGHDPGPQIDEVPATCISTGVTAGKRCLRCDGVAEGLEPIEIDPNNHVGPLETVPARDPTCTEPGLKAWERCTSCDRPVAEPEEIPAKGHHYTAGKKKTETIMESTCAKAGLTAEFNLCDDCDAVEECKVCEKLKDDEEKRDEYHQHLKEKHNGQELPLKKHTPGEPHYRVKTEATCLTDGVEVWSITCTVCGEVIEDFPDDVDYPARPIPKTGHTPTRKEADEDLSTKATCLTDGETVYKETKCTVCGEVFRPDPEVIKAAGEHKWENIAEKVLKEATCTETGLLETGGRKCSVCGAEEPPSQKEIPLKAHTWTNPQPDPDKKDQDVPPKCGDPGVSHVIVTCSVCGKTEAQAIEVPATGTHSWGEWTTTKQPTATEEGEESRTCTICGKVDTRAVSPTGPDPDDPDKPDKPTPPPEDNDFTITLVPSANGTSSVSKTTAKKGETITVTYAANSGYVLDMIRVIGGSELVSYTNLGNGQIRFTMPAANVEVRVTFDRADANYGESWGNGFGSEGGNRSDPRRTTDVVPVQGQGYSVPKADAHEQVFQDVPTGHWAAGEINWAHEMGYMSGTSGRFNPDGLITHQQMWMILARITGASPANMAEARHWAVRGGYADGSSPTGAVKRHQLVTALHRCARLTTAVSKNNTSLAGYTDSTAVPIRAREAFSWALTSGVITGDADGRLNPTRNLTRAEFAVILYCYHQRH